MRILRARRTARFVYLLVRCRCGKRFGHQAQRRWIVCFHCGRIAEAAKAPRARSVALGHGHLDPVAVDRRPADLLAPGRGRVSPPGRAGSRATFGVVSKPIVALASSAGAAPRSPAA